ncbi:MAG: hypothetical protein AAF961_09330, partial [Planctomycetota bacterium]
MSKIGSTAQSCGGTTSGNLIRLAPRAAVRAALLVVGQQEFHFSDFRSVYPLVNKPANPPEMA